MELKGKRLLLLGGSMWKEAIAAFAKEHEITLIATGNNRSAGIFEIADEGYEVDSTDAPRMKQLITEKKIDGVYMGGSEPVISAACQYLNELDMPCYCTKQQWEYLQNKGNFKELCVKFGLPVVPRYVVTEQNLEEIPADAYPVITKPADGCGSSGFSVCNDIASLKQGYEKAKADSATGSVIVEKFVKNEGVVVFLTFSNGELYFSGLENKYPVRYEKEGSYVAGLLTLESELTDQFRALFEDKIRGMMRAIGIREGSVWIEVFHDNGQYYFNEVGYRYGGTVSVYPVDYFYGINQVAADMYYALTGQSKISGHTSLIPSRLPKKKFYAVYPIHLNAGKIARIHGLEQLRGMENIVIVPTTKGPGDVVYQTGSFSQAYALVHMVFDTDQELKDTLDCIHDTLVVEEENGSNMIHRMLDLKRI